MFFFSAVVVVVVAAAAGACAESRNEALAQIRRGSSRSGAVPARVGLQGFHNCCRAICLRRGFVTRRSWLSFPQRAMYFRLSSVPRMLRAGLFILAQSN